MFNISFNHNPNAFRLIFLVLAIPLFWFVGKNGYQLINRGTDGSAIQTSVSRLYVTRDVPAYRVVKVKRLHLTFNKVERGIRTGDLVRSIDSRQVYTAADVRKVLGDVLGNERFIIEVQRPTRRDFFLVFEVQVKDLPDNFIWQIPPTVYVWDVPPGGAADRAGIRTGDLIHEINGRPFKDRAEAESLVKSTLEGETVDYGIIRKGAFLTFKVTMARLAIPFSLILYELVGFFWLISGLGLALLRPSLKAARILAAGFFCLGSSFLLFERPLSPGLEPGFSSLQQVALILLYAGVAFLLHASYFLPRERRAWLASPFARRCNSVILAVAVVWTILAPISSMLPCLTAFLLAHLLIRFSFRKRKGGSRPFRERYILFGAALAALAFTAWYLTGSRLPETWDLLLRAVPSAILLAVYLYTIGRFHLFGLRVGRGIQYNTISLLWTLLLLWFFGFLLHALATLELPAFNISLSARDIEIHNRDVDPGKHLANEKLLLMAAALFLGYCFIRIGRAGRRFLMKKFHRTAYDDNQASHELNELLAGKHALDELARGIVTKLAQLMLLKRVGILFYKDGEILCSQDAFGHEEDLGFCRTSGSKPDKFVSFCRQEGRALARTMGQFKSELCVEYLYPEVKKPLAQEGFKYVYPILSREMLVGCLLMGEKRSEMPYRPADFQFLSDRAVQVAAAVENAFLYEKLAGQERLKQELELARHIQTSSLPQQEPEVNGLDVSGASIPAMEVGGDYYAYFHDTDREFTLIVGDVSGKGTSAALYMSKMQGIFSSLQGRLGPKELFLKANPILYREMEKNAFATAICGRFLTSARFLRLARAGHVPLFCFRAETESLEKHKPNGLALGIENAGLFSKIIEEETLEYKAQDVFLFLSDGLTEALNRKGEPFGEKRIIQLILNHAHRNAREIRDNILEEIHYFTEGANQHDDETLVVVKAR